MLVQILLWGLVVGLIHFFIIGILYGNPIIDKIYQNAQKQEPGVKEWTSRIKYLVIQFLGTQIEVFIITAGYFWIQSFYKINGVYEIFVIGLLFAGLRVYPRFWNMWIQSTYPNVLLLIEAINGTISTYVIVITLSLLPIN